MGRHHGGHHSSHRSTHHVVHHPQHHSHSHSRSHSRSRVQHPTGFSFGRSAVKARGLGGGHQRRNCAHAFRCGKGRTVENKNVTLSVTLQRSPRIFYPGNIVEGVLQVKVTSPVMSKSLRLKMIGKEIRVEDGGQSTAIYVEQTVTIFGPTLPQAQAAAQASTPAASSSPPTSSVPVAPPPNSLDVPMVSQSPLPAAAIPSVVLSPGSYSYPFCFQLPANIPPTISTILPLNSHIPMISSDSLRYFVEVVYEIKATMEIESDLDAMSSTYFDVISVFPSEKFAELNVDPPASIRSEANISVERCCCCSLGVIASAEGTAFQRVVSCQPPSCSVTSPATLKVRATIDNALLKTSVSSVEFSLVRTTLVRMYRVQQIVSKTVSTSPVSGGGQTFGSPKSSCFEGTLTLPPTIGATMKLSLASIEFEVLVKVEFAAWFSSSAACSELLRIPIVVAQAVMDIPQTAQSFEPFHNIPPVYTQLYNRENKLLRQVNDPPPAALSDFKIRGEFAYAAPPTSSGSTEYKFEPLRIEPVGVPLPLQEQEAQRGNPAISTTWNPQGPSQLPPIQWGIRSANSWDPKLAPPPQYVSQSYQAMWTSVADEAGEDE